MLDAYRGTTDDQGESLQDAIREVEAYFSPAAENLALIAPSVLVVEGETAVSACLVQSWRRRGCPLIGYVICRASYKGLGFAALALHESLRRLRQAQHDEVRAVITEGNVASERLFLAAGFEVV